uniref:Secreted protein n=1 Tax=Panthera leo TaxID=9689 RepID=A0A8C8X428_PANLE
MTPRFLAPCFLLLLTGEGVEPVTSSNHKTSPQLSIRISFFFLSFSISNLQFNSCLEDPNTGYYQELQRNVSEWARICGGRMHPGLPTGHHRCPQRVDTA